jgi:TolB protein
VVAGRQSRIAFVSDLTGSLEIFTVNADGSDVKQVTHDEAASIYPSWAPDGERLAYCLKINQRGAPDRFEIVEIKLDGTGQRYITSDGGVATFPSWSPDGLHLNRRSSATTQNLRRQRRRHGRAESPTTSFDG